MALKRYKGSGIVWDKKNNKPLVKFPKGGGDFDTEDKTVQEELERLGFTPEVLEADPPIQTKIDILTLDVAKIDKWKGDELRAYGKEKFYLEFAEKATKAEMAAAIKAELTKAQSEGAGNNSEE